MLRISRRSPAVGVWRQISYHYIWFNETTAFGSEFYTQNLYKLRSEARHSRYFGNTWYLNPERIVVEDLRPKTRELSKIS